MLIRISKGSDWLRQLQSQLMDMSAFIEDFAENAISIIYFYETAASKKSIEIYNDAMWYYLLSSEYVPLDWPVGVTLNTLKNRME